MAFMLGALYASTHYSAEGPAAFAANLSQRFDRVDTTSRYNPRTYYPDWQYRRGVYYWPGFSFGGP
jgi:hypothetical protein